LSAHKRWLLLLMGALVLTIGAARGAASLTASQVLVGVGKPTRERVTIPHVNPRLILRYRTAVWHWQALMGTPRLRRGTRPNTVPELRFWRRTARRAYAAFTHPPHVRAWLCIHRYEGSWSDGGGPYWGGLQMDRGFMDGYAPGYLLRRGWANRWTPLEQMWVAERGYRSRGFFAWPNTARMCGLIS
jgi:hypothetical protein